ncbi:MAG: hypothetical protein MJA28_05860 [Gammaproteobacteria bacterium]|nr:hypothetical protein [Gammaproteobacteria bacterium]
MSKTILQSKDLMTMLSDQFKIEHNKITGQFCHGDLPVIESGKSFYFRSQDINDTVTATNPATGYVAEMPREDADFLASMLAITMIGWERSNSELFACNSAMHKECRASRPGIVEFFG